MGGNVYSSEECGTIAIQCPINKSVMHVMENQIIEINKNGEAIISTLTNKYIRRYKIGDCMEFGTCTCGRTLQTIKNVQGRIRNMFILPNGDKKFPLVGSKEYYERFGIKRYKATQTSLTNIDLEIVCDPLGNREDELVSVVQKWLAYPVHVTIKYVEGFANYKFEEFVSLIT